MATGEGPAPGLVTDRPLALRVLVAPDSYKGTLTSVEVARAIADGWRQARPGDEIALAPLADGGEGTLVAVEASGGWVRREARVHDPIGREITRPVAGAR